MPHCIIEYAQAMEDCIRPSELVSLVHSGAVKTELFDSRQLKTRAIPYRDFINGCESDHFVNVTFRMLSGRSSAQKKQLTDQVLAELEKINTTSIVLTVEVRDMDRGAYSKTLRG